MARFRGFVVVVSILFISLFGTNIVSSLPEEVQITILEENPICKLEESFIETSAEIQSYENFGDQKDFWTANLQTQEWFQVRATLLAVGDHCYIYMDNRTITPMGQSQAIERSEILSSEFDNIVYPKNFELMGSPNGTLGDIDNDPRITVFLVQGVGSYYLQHNELPGTTNSNNREMVYVSTGMQLVNTIAVMCHETNHLFLFNYDLNEAVFFIEGLAEFSMYNAGYMSNSSFMQGGMTLNVTMSAYQYSLYPSVSLFFFDENYYSYSSYGAGYMFLFYLTEKYGIEIIRDLIPIDSLDGPPAIENVLSAHGYNISFNEIFLDFITACTIDELGIYDDLYGFLNADYSTNTKRLIYELPFSISNVKHRYYGIEINEITEVPNEFTLEIETPDYPRSLGVVTIIHDDNGWNITQAILTGDGSSVLLLCEGVNIDQAYVITSMIKEGTPNAPLTWMESPYNLLDFSIKEGHPPATIDETRLVFLSLIPLILVAVILTKRFKT
ncbi:MAG: hypothetical protein HeimAB125_22890 [Candidatus Heimdallarchaeota archaeon AB_125]|nr:MAG: hypothetical protein HeimAB125_22890 [Candidatus Heimdallarchaeota archaeon AB_125]